MNSQTAKRALITGITGQDGSYLADLLLAKGYEVFGMVRRSSTSSTDRIDHLLDDPAKVTLVNGDLADDASLRQVLDLVRPEEIYNLAAQSHVSVSFEMPVYTSDVTGMGVLRLLEAVRELDLQPTTRLYQAASSEMFGNAVEAPQDETTPLMPRNPYAVAKVFGFHAVRTYREAYGIYAVNGILFNHESPRRGLQFVTRKISYAVAEIAHQRREAVALGNLDACRDWGFAGDYVEAMWQMLQQETPQDFVIATGKTHSVREFCERAFHRIGMTLNWRGAGIDEHGVDSQGRSRVVVDPKYFRPAEVNSLLGNASKAREQFGWEPQCNFEQLVDMMVDADVERLGGLETSRAEGMGR